METFLKKKKFLFWRVDKAKKRKEEGAKAGKLLACSLRRKLVFEDESSKTTHFLGKKFLSIICECSASAWFFLKTPQQSVFTYKSYSFINTKETDPNMIINLKLLFPYSICHLS